MKGISVWMFSKIVMLVFLLVTFSTLMSFMKISREKVDADSAQALAMQIKDSMQTAIYTSTVSSQSVVPIPKTLPESGESATTGKLKDFTVVVGRSSVGGNVVYIAIGWGASPTTYSAASSFIVDSSIIIKPDTGLVIPSNKYRYFVVKKQNLNELCIQACNSTFFSQSQYCIGCW
jgi:hypothetical protein